jgi:8-oxo-dGTP pyrophosphatase MutT (NUDIX family)
MIKLLTTSLFNKPARQKPALPTGLLPRLEAQLRFAQHRTMADAAVLLAVTDEADPRILLSRRASHLNQHAGEVSLPGGKRDASDTSNIAVALREAWEETALDPFAVRLLGELPTQTSRSGLRVKPIVGVIPAETVLTAHPDEIERIFFMPLSVLLAGKPIPHRVQMKAGAFVVPSFQVDGEVVWGLTGRILVDLARYGLGKKIDWPIFYITPRKAE